MPNTILIRESAQKIITKKLENVSGPKDLVIDIELMTPMDRILGASMLKSTGVDKIFKLENATGPIKGNIKRVYIVKCKPNAMKMISTQINIDRDSGIICAYHILMVPRKLYNCEKVLEEEGVYGYVTVDSLPINFIVIDDDIISLEAHEFFKNYYLHRDQTCLYEVSSSLVDIQKIYGPIANVFILGECAHKAEQLMKILLKKEDSQESPTISSSSSSASFLNVDRSQSFTHLLLVDRVCDCITPFCSQVTYEGLLDDTFNINCGYVQLGPEITNSQKMTKVLLSNQDKIFGEIRDRHFSNVSTFLSAKAKELQQGYDKRINLDISGTKNFIQKDLKNLMNQHNSLSIHVGISEHISQKKTRGEIDLLLRVEHSLLEGVDIKECCTHIEELINKQVDEYKCLSLMCMLSLTEGGLSLSLYKSLTLQFMQSYGYDLLSGLTNLKRLGLLVESNQFAATQLLNRVVNVNPIKSFRTVCRKLNLIPKSADMINLKNPCDMSYVFSGAYTPMLCKVIELILQYDGYTGLEEMLRLLAVPTQSNQAPKSAKSSPSVVSTPSSAPKKTVLVYILGGCTYSEISALRLLAKMRGYEIVVATTSIINGQSLLRSLIE